MDQYNVNILNRIFTRNTIRELIDDSKSDAFYTAVHKYFYENHNLTNSDLFSKIYNLLRKRYRNEYFYKNTLLNKLLLGVHSTNTTTALTEVAISRSKADFVLINGKAVVYEIKTELDNFDRLESQLNDYYKAFSYVTVITCESNYATLKCKLEGTPVGICVLTNREMISQRKKPIEYKDNLDLNVIFKMLTKPEYEKIILDCFGVLPNTAQFDYYRTCKKKFCTINIDKVYSCFLHVLKLRNKISNEMFSRIPYELKFVVYFFLD